MINRLINMNPVIQIKEKAPVNRINASIEDYAKAFIEGMGETQKSRFKKMLENNIKCGMSVAENYGINYQDFIAEVKKQMGVV